MIKNKLDFKLVNIAIITAIVYLVYSTSSLWLGILAKVWKIITPFFFAFIIAYALHPILRALQNKKIPKSVSVGIIILGAIGLLAFILFLIVPLLATQLTNLFNNI